MTDDAKTLILRLLALLSVALALAWALPAHSRTVAPRVDSPLTRNPAAGY